MTRLIFPLFLLCAFFYIANLATARPNIVVFLTDDHSQSDSSPYGHPDFKTPNMQKLADSGLTFDHAYVPSPSCAPSRAALLTGLMPARNGAEPNHSKPREDIKKWPAYFQDLGYEVVAYGKISHYKHTADYGFDIFAHDAFHDHAAIPAAAKFLRGRSATNTTRPLCLMVGSNWPHVPWPKVEEIDTTYTLPAGSIDTIATQHARAQYAAAVENADKDLGVIQQAIKETLGDETLILFSGDHGTQWPFGKWNLYDAGIRVPLIVSWPGKIAPGTRTQAMVSWVDILPTLLEAAGAGLPTDIDGKSFLSVLTDRKAEHRDKIFTTHSGDGRWNIYPMRSVRTPQYKYIRNLHPEFAFTSHLDLAGDLARPAYWISWEEAAKTNPAAAAIVKRYHQRPAEELYDPTADPNEQNNLAANPDQQTRLQELALQLDIWMESQGDKQTVPGEPRLLSDPTSHGPLAPSPDLSTTPTGPSNWILPKSPDDPLTWGRRDGIIFGIPSKGGMSGPRGLIRIGRMKEGSEKPYLINFIAVEPVVPGHGNRLDRMSFSELEPSQLDPEKNGKRQWVESSGTLEMLENNSSKTECLTVRIEVEASSVNKTRVYIIARVYGDRPDELELEVNHYADTIKPEELTLTATMGNKGRLRQLWLADRIVDSRELYKGYDGDAFIEKESYPFRDMLTYEDGDAIVLATTNEADPESVRIPTSPSWEYKFKPLTHYWRVAGPHIEPNLRTRVNGRHVYWMSETPIPGGAAIENFEVRQRYVPGQRFIFGLTEKEPWNFDPKIPGLPDVPQNRESNAGDRK